MLHSLHQRLQNKNSVNIMKMAAFFVNRPLRYTFNIFFYVCPRSCLEFSLINRRNIQYDFDTIV